MNYYGGETLSHFLDLSNHTSFNANRVFVKRPYTKIKVGMVSTCEQIRKSIHIKSFRHASSCFSVCSMCLICLCEQWWALQRPGSINEGGLHVMRITQSNWEWKINILWQLSCHRSKVHQQQKLTQKNVAAAYRTHFMPAVLWGV